MSAEWIEKNSQPIHKVIAEKKESLREEAFQQSFQYGTKIRFGLFSQPASTAIGDTNLFKAKEAKKDADGKPIVGPKNFYTTRMKVGHTDSILFGRPSYVSIGNPFQINALQGMRSFAKDGHLKAGHDKAFSPARDPHEKVKAIFPYIEQGVGKKKNFKDAEGAVIIGPRNFLISPMKEGKVGKMTTLGGNIPYIEDDYNIKKKLEQKEREYHLSKVQEKPFSNMAKHTETFNTLKQVYMEDPPIPPRKQSVDPQKGEPLHDKAFKPANPGKAGIVGAFEKFPHYLPNPPREIKRKIPVEGEEERRGFRATTKVLTRPTPSIAVNYRNLKASYPSQFTSPVRI